MEICGKPLARATFSTLNIGGAVGMILRGREKLRPPSRDSVKTMCVPLFHSVQRAMWANRAVKSFECAVVITRQAGPVVNFDRLGPGFSTIRRTAQHDERASQCPARPSDVQIAGIASMAVIRNNVGLVFPWNGRKIWLAAHGNVVCFPRRATVKRAANIKPVA